MAMRPCIGLILAGGRSRRMGEDKARLALADGTLLAWQVARLAPYCHRLVVSGDYPEFDSLPDVQTDLGPLGGLQAAALRFPGASLWALPVDMPAFDGVHLQALMQEPTAAHYREHPLPAFFADTRAVAAAIAAMLALPEPDRSIRELHRRLGSVALPAPDAAVLRNLNTPDEWASFRAGR